MKFLLMVISALFYYGQSLSQNAVAVFTDARDGKEYKTVRIGHQIWFAENFAYLPVLDSANVSVFNFKGNSIANAKSTNSYQHYGALYSWEAAKKLAPEGWRLPTDADWQQLEKHLGMSIKEANTIGWRGKAEANTLKLNGESGFNVVFGGWKTDYGEYKFQEQHCNFWCADSFDNNRAFERLIGVKNTKIGREYGNKGCGFSVRYVRDLPEQSSIVYPNTSWSYCTKPEEYGWNPDKIKALHQYVRDSTYATGVMIVQSGKVLFDYGNTEELSYIASCRKSILSMLYGKYVENGTISLQTTLAELHLDDVGGLLASEKTATIQDLLQSKSGVFHLASNEGGNEFLFPERGSKKPGTYFVYNNWDFNAAGYIFEQKTGMSIYQAFEKDIAKPIGLEDWDLSKQQKTGDTTKSKFKAYHFTFSTRDMAKIGYLMLRNGKWNDKQIIPAQWVKRMTSLTTGLEEMKTVDPRLKNWPWYLWGYGLMWRVWDSPTQAPELHKAYTATGNMGQYITILPALDIVIAIKTKPDYGRRTEYEPYLRFLDTVIDAKK